MVDVFNVGTGLCFPTLDTFWRDVSLEATEPITVITIAEHWRRQALPRIFNSSFGLTLLVKDLGIAQEFMQLNQSRTVFRELLKGYLGDALEQVDQQVDHTESLRGQ